MFNRLPVLAGALIAALALAGTADAATTPKRSSSKLKLATKNTITTGANGVQHHHYVFGPVHIAPGQNSIFLEDNSQMKPKEDGFIMNFDLDLIATTARSAGRSIHLHHAVDREPARWAAGERRLSPATPPASDGRTRHPSSGR